MSISLAICTVSSDFNKTLANTFKILGSFDTVVHSALNGPSPSTFPNLLTSSNVSLEITLSS